MLRNWLLAAAMVILPTYALAQATGERSGAPLSGVRSGEPRSGVRGGAGGSGAGVERPVFLSRWVGRLEGAPGVPLNGSPAFPQDGR